MGDLPTISAGEANSYGQEEGKSPAREALAYTDRDPILNLGANRRCGGDESKYGGQRQNAKGRKLRLSRFGSPLSGSQRTRPTKKSPAKMNPLAEQSVSSRSLRAAVANARELGWIR